MFQLKQLKNHKNKMNYSKKKGGFSKNESAFLKAIDREFKLNYNVANMRMFFAHD
jgi:hypothetical protein